MANQAPVVPDVQQLQDALAVPPAQVAQNVDGGEQPAVVAAPVAVPAAQPVHLPYTDVVSCSWPLLAYVLSFCYRSLLCFTGHRSIVYSFPAYVFLRLCLDHSVIVRRFYSEFVPPLLVYRICPALFVVSWFRSNCHIVSYCSVMLSLFR